MATKNWVGEDKEGVWLRIEADSREEAEAFVERKEPSEMSEWVFEDWRFDRVMVKATKGEKGVYQFRIRK